MWLCGVMLCYFVLLSIMLCSVVLCCVMLCYLVLCGVRWFYVVLVCGIERAYARAADPVGVILTSF